MDEAKLFARLEVRVNEAEKSIARFNQSADRSLTQFERRARAASTRVNAALKSSVVGFAAGFAGAFSIEGARQLIDTATRIRNSLKVAGLEGQNLTTVYDALFASAQRNAAPLESLVTLYSRAAQSAGDLEKSQAELLEFTDNVALSLRAGGGSAQEASGALLQLSQALGNGTVQAEEFNSLLDGARPLLQAAAAGIKEAGGSVSALTRLVKEGKVSSLALFDGINAGASTLQESVEGAQQTISSQFQRLQNSLVQAAGRFDDASKSSDALGGSLNDLASYIDAIDFGSIFAQLDAFGVKFDAARQAVNNWAAAMGQAVGLDAVGEALTNNSVANSLGLYSGRAVERRMSGEVPAEPSGAVADYIQRTYKGSAPLEIDVTKPAGQVSVEDPRYKPPPRRTGGGGGRKAKASESDYAREIAQIKERTAAITAETTAQAGVNPLVADYDFAINKAKSSTELLNAAQKSGLAVTPELKATVDLLADGYAKASAEAGRLSESQDRARQTAEDFRDLGRDTLGGFIRDLRDGTSATEALGNALAKVGDKLIDVGLNTIFGGGGSGGGLFSGSGGAGLLGGKIIPGILHGGGIAGRDGYGHGRSVSPGVFAGAPRMHQGGIAGLKLGEVPAILQAGEMVLPKGTKAGGSRDEVRIVLQDDSGRMAGIADQQIRTSAGTIVRLSVEQSIRAVKSNLGGLLTNYSLREG